MRAFDVVRIVTWEAGTFVLALALLLPAGLQADSGPAAMVQPKLSADGVDLTVRLENGQDGVGGLARLPNGMKPMLVLVARNTTGQSINIHPVVNVLATSQASMLSRVLVLPKSIWQHECPLTLAAGGEQTVRLEVDAPIPGGSMVTVRIESGAASANALSFSTAGQVPATLPSLAAGR